MIQLKCPNNFWPGLQSEARSPQSASTPTMLVPSVCKARCFYYEKNTNLNSLGFEVTAAGHFQFRNNEMGNM